MAGALLRRDSEAIERADADQLRQLGHALGAAVTEIAEAVRLTWRQRCADSAHADPRVDVDIVRTTSLATLAVAQYLLHGDPESDEHKRMLAATGRAPLRNTISLTDLTKLYLYWRDVTLATVHEAAHRLSLDDDAVAAATAVVRAGSDGSIVRMVKEFDRERCRLQEHLAEEQRLLAHRAFHDALTGLPNRVLFFDRLAHALDGAARRGSELALLFIDIDRFKLVNDTRGHCAGDLLLAGVATRLRETVRASDTVARLAGDEFVILCEEVGPARAEAVALAARIATALREPIETDAGPVCASVSIGIAVRADDDEPDTFLRRADHAMYAAKRAGGARHHLAVANET
jgi:diguanylate cyclase (GGDEF)-like protein